MSAPEAGSSLPLPVSLTEGGPAGPPAAESGVAAPKPQASPGRPPAAGPTPPRPRRSTDSAGTRRSTDGGSRRSLDGGASGGGGTTRRGRHTVEVPEGAERHEGLVVSRQEKFGFIKCSTHEGRYFFHVNDSDGAATYGSIVSFVVARDLTTGKDVAYRVKTLQAGPVGAGGGSPAGGGAAAGRASAAAGGNRSSTPDRYGRHAGPAAAAAMAALQQPQAHAPEQAAATALAAAAAPVAEDGTVAAPSGGSAATEAALTAPAAQQPQAQVAGPAAQPPHRQPSPSAAAHLQQQHGRRQHQQGPGAGEGGQPRQRTGFEHFGQHRQPSPATQRDWRLPQQQAAEQRQREREREREGAEQAAAAAAAAAVAEPARYRGTVAQVARAARQHQMDDGLLLYIDENGAQQQARYGNWRLAEGTQRLEPGDVVEFELAGHPQAPAGPRKFASNVHFLSKGLQHTPSLDAALAAAESGDPLRGRQLGRVTLLKKEFGFIQQMDRPGDMFFHFSQLQGWTAEDIKVGDDVEYTIRQDREGKLSAVQIRRAPPGSVVFEVVGEELLRGVVLERPMPGKQYQGTSGVLEYSTAAVLQSAAAGTGGGAGGAEEGGSGGEGAAKSRLPFSPQDVVAGSGALRPGDHVTFRICTNLQAAKAAALASVPGAAQYAGRHAVQVSFVRYGGLVDKVNRERQFGFIAYGEDDLLPAGATSAGPAAAADAAGAGAASEGEDGAAAAAGAAAAGGGDAAPDGSAAGVEGQAPEPAAAPEAAAEAGASVFTPAVGAGGAEGAEAAPPASAAAAAASEAGADGSAPGGAAADVAPPAAPAPAPAPAAAVAGPLLPLPIPLPKPRPNRIFFHFKEVSGQYVLKAGDEVAFVLHTNLKSGELNAQRVRRTKEAPQPPPAPEPAPRPTPVPAVNPNRNKYSGNLSVGSYKQPKIAKGPDGTRGFEYPRPHAVMPPLPGLEPKVELEAGAAGAGEEGGAAQEQAAAVAAAEPAAAATTLAGPPAPSAPVPVPVPAPAAASSAGGSVGSPASWHGNTPFSALASMPAGTSGSAGGGGAKKLGLGAALSVGAPVFVPRSVSNSSLDKHFATAAAAVPAAPVAAPAPAPPQQQE